jgi:hypothetical protein
MEPMVRHWVSLATRVQFGLPQSLTADEYFTPVAHHRTRVQPEAAKRADLQVWALPAD